MVESIDGKLDLLLGANPDVRKHVQEMFRGKKRLAQIYLYLDEEGDHTQTSTLDYLAKVFGSSKPNIIQQVRPLRMAGIIDAVELPNGKTLLKKNSCERVFSISRFLKKEFGLDEPQRTTIEPDAQVAPTEPLSK